MRADLRCTGFCGNLIPPILSAFTVASNLSEETAMRMPSRTIWRSLSGIPICENRGVELARSCGVKSLPPFAIAATKSHRLYRCDLKTILPYRSVIRVTDPPRIFRQKFVLSTPASVSHRLVLQPELSRSAVNRPKSFAYFSMRLSLILSVRHSRRLWYRNIRRSIQQARCAYR